MTCTDELPALWAAATSHPFLDGVRHGTLPVAAFDTWLAQDALLGAVLRQEAEFWDMALGDGRPA